MVTFAVERKIGAPAEEIFDWLADSSNYESSPLVLRERRVRDGEQAPYGVGAVREITAIGAWFRERVTLYERPREFRYVIEKSLPRIKHDGGSIVLEQLEECTRVVWRTSYTVPTVWGGALTARALEAPLRWSFTTLLTAAERALTGPPASSAAGSGGDRPPPGAHAPFALMNRAVNPGVRAILRSPLHPLLSGRLALITFTGRRSGRPYTIPVLYELEADTVRIPVEWPARKRWWRNLRDEAPVELLLRGRRLPGSALASERDGRVSVEVGLEPSSVSAISPDA